MAPVVAVNTPNFEAGKDTQIGYKSGTVGHPLPGVAARIVDPSTFEPLPVNSQGLLLVKGSNRMTGYLNQPGRTAESLRDGWYVTGDIALIDDEGFLRITDRLSRFSKIAGEMAPHVKIEEAISASIGDAPCAVTAIPDEQRNTIPWTVDSVVASGSFLSEVGLPMPVLLPEHAIVLHASAVED